MRTLKWALASVEDAIGFSDDQALHEAFKEAKDGADKMDQALIEIAEPQQQQRGADFLDNSAVAAPSRPTDPLSIQTGVPSILSPLLPDRDDVVQIP